MLTLTLPVALAAVPMTESAYFSGTTVTIIGLEIAQNPPLQAQADFFQVVRHDLSGNLLGSITPQCNPCDHDGMGIDFLDFHDHVLDAIPNSSSQFRVLWHVFVVLPAISGLSPTAKQSNDATVLSTYSSLMPATSEAAVMALGALKLSDGSPVALIIDTHFFFLCAVVNPNASH